MGVSCSGTAGALELGAAESSCSGPPECLQKTRALQAKEPPALLSCLGLKRKSQAQEVSWGKGCSSAGFSAVPACWPDRCREYRNWTPWPALTSWECKAGGGLQGHPPLQEVQNPESQQLLARQQAWPKFPKLKFLRRKLRVNLSHAPSRHSSVSLSPRASGHSSSPYPKTVAVNLSNKTHTFPLQPEVCWCRRLA